MIAKKPPYVLLKLAAPTIIAQPGEVKKRVDTAATQSTIKRTPFDKREQQRVIILTVSLKTETVNKTLGVSLT